MNTEICPVCGKLIDSLFWLAEIEVIDKNLSSNLRVEKVCDKHFQLGWLLWNRQFDKDELKINLILETGAME